MTVAVHGVKPYSTSFMNIKPAHEVGLYPMATANFSS